MSTRSRRPLYRATTVIQTFEGIVATYRTDDILTPDLATVLDYQGVGSDQVAPWAAWGTPRITVEHPAGGAVDTEVRLINRATETTLATITFTAAEITARTVKDSPSAVGDVPLQVAAVVSSQNAGAIVVNVRAGVAS